MAKTKKVKAEEQKPFEQLLWASADKMRKNIDAAEYKHYVPGLLFLKYVSDAFEELYNKIVNKEGDHAYDDPEDKLVYSSQYVFFVPKQARWSYLVSRAKFPTIGEDIAAVADTYHHYMKGDSKYQDVTGFCKVASIDEVKQMDYVLTPGRYIVLPDEEDDFNFSERFAQLKAELEKQMQEEVV